MTWARHFVCETWSYLWKSTRCNILVCTVFQTPIEMSNNVAWLTDVMSHFWCSFMAINTSISSSWAMLDNFHLGPVRKYVHWTFIKKVFNEIFPARKCMRSGIFWWNLVEYFIFLNNWHSIYCGITLKTISNGCKVSSNRLYLLGLIFTVKLYTRNTEPLEKKVNYCCFYVFPFSKYCPLNFTL